MLRSARLVPSFIFPNYPLCFPSISPMFQPFIYQSPRTAILAPFNHFKTLITFAFILSLFHDSNPITSSLYPGLYLYLHHLIDRPVGSCLRSI